jgi:hypothetical protein
MEPRLAKVEKVKNIRNSLDGGVLCPVYSKESAGH